MSGDKLLRREEGEDWQERGGKEMGKMGLVERERGAQKEWKTGTSAEKDGKNVGGGLGDEFRYKYADIAVPGQKNGAVSRVSVIFHGQCVRLAYDDFMQIKDGAYKSPIIHGTNKFIRGSRLNRLLVVGEQ